jgi:hypothetical protein
MTNPITRAVRWYAGDPDKGNAQLMTVAAMITLIGAFLNWRDVDQWLMAYFVSVAASFAWQVVYRRCNHE